MASMYAVYHGAEGLAAITRRVNRLATVLAAGLKSLGFAPLSTGFFDTVTVDAGDRAGSIIAAAAAAGVNLRRVDGSRIGISLDETTTPEIVEQVWAAFGGRSEEHTSELQSLMRISYAVLCLQTKNQTPRTN